MGYVRTAALAAFALPGLFASGAMAAQDDTGQLSRGAYLATAADCAACHTNPNGGAPFAGGYAIASPMGNIVATNITPSKEYGIGSWSEEEFARAIREGVTPNGTHLYPAMPYPSYAKLTDEDVSAIYDYLMTEVEPVDAGLTEKTELPFPFNVRALMAGWNLLFTDAPGWTPPEGLDASEERGAYLVQALEHCSTCHTPRGPLMNSQQSAFLGGASLGSWRAPNITPDAQTGIGDWSKDEIVTYLRDGHAPGRASAAGPMAEAVEYSLSHLEGDDLGAIAAYLKTVPAVSTPEDGVAPDAQVHEVALTSYETTDWTGNPDDLARHDTTEGAALYNGACAACHGVDGKGASDGHFPDLTTAASVTGQDPSNLVMTIAEGISRHDANGYTVMPAFADDLDNAQIAGLTNYVAANFGGREPGLDADGVAQIRAGGSAPWLIQNAAWLTWVGIAAALIILLAVVALIWRRKAQPAG
ncbi:hypothetical protein AYJ57_19065 [Salipiger sp. CCB-MM3]|uniref:cytochrome c n=1 Tax=Salipiger sp. CCB-MM3 TaxID=1792508 RepID=UPI00080AA922|nr:cytochrome c [Salipiger sp. CCB-MM3]ANT62494.1 hypothetical protein AYJ57_19065 [Salipiger sp. CCB-MM3]